MIRILHTACAGLLVVIALVAYGVKEETGALREEVQRLTAQKAAMQSEIQRLETEWAYLNGPEQLLAIARRVYGADPHGAPRLLGGEGELLIPWRPEQVATLQDLPFRSEATDGAGRSRGAEGGAP